MNRTADSHFHGGRLIGTSYIRMLPLRLPRAIGIGPGMPPAAPADRLFLEPPLAHAPSRLIVRGERMVAGRSGLSERLRSWLYGHAAAAQWEGEDARLYQRT